MKKLKVAFFTVLIVCMMSFCILTASAQIVDSGTCGENVSWTFDDSGCLTISGTGRMGEISLTDSWYPHREDIKKVIIESGVTNISESAFQNCINLVSVTMPDSVTSIENWAFVVCTSLSDIKLSPNVTSIGIHAFAGCDSLVSITIPASVTSIAEGAFNSGGAFEKFEVEEANTAYCSVDGVLFDKAKTTLIKYPSAKEGETYSIPNGVTTIKEDAFNMCKDIQSIMIPSSVTSVPYRSIFGCAKLTAINVAEDNTKYCSVDGVLFNKDKTTLVLYPKGKADTEYIIPEGIVNIEQAAFEWCENLKSVTIPSGVKDIRYQSFANCTNLEEIRLPSSITNIGNYAFVWCENLTIYGYAGSVAEIYAIENSIPFEIVAGSHACGDNLLWALDAEGTLTISGTGRMADYTDGNPAPWYSIRDRIKIVWLDNGVMSVGDNAFNSCANLTRLVVPSSLSNIGVNAFFGCSGFEGIGFVESTSSSDKEWSRVFIESGNESLTDVEKHQFTPYIGYIASSERVYDADKNEYYLQMTLICEDGKFAARTATDIKNFDSETYDFSGAVGALGKNEPFATGKFIKFTVNYEGEVERLDNRNIEKISKCVRFNEGVAEEGLYLVNVTNERNGALYFINANVEISGDATAYENAIANAISLNFGEDGYEIVGFDGDEYVGASLVKLPRRGDTLVDGTGNAVIRVDGNGEIIIVFSYVDSFTLEEESEEAIAYSFGQSVQIGLIEPWFIKANARVYTDEYPTNIDYSTLSDYGAYFIRASELSDTDATQDTLTVEDIINDSDSVKYSKSEGTATIDGSYITANYDKGLYTYELDDSVFVLFYIEDESGIIYASIRERNLKKLCEERKDDTANFTNVLERNVYTFMDKLELDIGTYRAQFDEIEELPEQKALMLGEFIASNGAFEEETTKSYSFGNSVQLILVEPWGLKFNARVYNDANPININYDGVEEYGAIVYYDTEGKIDSMTAEELRTKSDAYVFSSKNGDAAIDGSYITAIYNKGIYTYQLDSNAYVMFYVKDADGYHYGDVKVRNAYELAKTRAQDTSGNFGEKEKTVYQDMVAMYDSVKAYRDDYFSKN